MRFYKSILVGVLLISLLFCCSCGMGKDSEITSGQFSTILDQSEMRWYLTQKYHADIDKEYHFYEIMNDGEELHVALIAKRVVDDASLPEYLLQIGHSDVDDWYEYRYDDYWGDKIGIVLEPNQVNELGETESGLVIKELVVTDCYYDSYYGSYDDMVFYILQDKDDSIHSVGISFGSHSGVLSGYAWYEKGNMIADYSYWGLEYKDYIKLDQKIGELLNNGNVCRIDNRYGEKGVLMERICTGSKNYHFTLSYDDKSSRTDLLKDGYYGSGNIHYERDDMGFVETIQEQNDNGYSAFYQIHYSPTGETTLEKNGYPVQGNFSNIGINSNTDINEGFDPTKDYQFISDYNIEGTWRNIGTGTFGQINSDSVVLFDGGRCNIYSPSDTYAFYPEGDHYVLQVTGLMGGDHSFIVYIIDKNHIDLVKGSNIIELEKN